MNQTKFASALFFSAVIALPSLGYAHGDEEHGDAKIGKAGDPAHVTRTIDVLMHDTMRFDPPAIQVKQGETIRFNLKNDGKVKHEMVLGDVAELKKHAALMLKFPDMVHEDPNQVSVESGKTGTMVWQFTKAGTVNFGCLQAGHYEAGMGGKVIVSAKK